MTRGAASQGKAPDKRRKEVGSEGGSEQRTEFFDGHTRLADEGTQRPAFDVAMVRDDQQSAAIRRDQGEMAALAATGYQGVPGVAQARSTSRVVMTGSSLLIGAPPAIKLRKSRQRDGP